MTPRAATSAGVTGKLPRGRHGIPKELVAANQRERILNGTADVFAEQGYGSLIVADVIARAGVSRATFYEFFSDKHGCVVAAQRHAFEIVRERFAGACSARGDWPHGVLEATGAALQFAAEEPGKAKLLLSFGYASTEPKLAADGLDFGGELVAILERGSLRCATASRPEGLSVQAAVGAVITIVGTFLGSGELAALPGLKAELARIVLTPYLGPGEALRAVSSS